MTRQEMEATVANLLLEQRRFRRLGTDLPPDKLSLLQRLLYRLGYTKMSRQSPKRYSAEVTEDDFHRQLDENPDDHHTRMVFADWLQERNDPRAEGYRAMGQLGFAPSKSVYHNDGKTWIWAHDKNTFGIQKGRYDSSKLPHSWLKRIKSNHPDYGHLGGIINPTPHWRYHTSRRSADDAAALAYDRLPKNTKVALAKRVKFSRAIQYARLTLSQPVTTESLGGEKINEHHLLDNTGKSVGKIHIRDRGPILHVDLIGGRGFRKGVGLTGMGRFGNEAMLSLHQEIGDHYPRAEYLRGHRVSGYNLRNNPAGEPTLVPIRRRKVKMSRQYPKRYAKFNANTPSHPLVAGFPLEHVLRNLANDPKNGNNIKNLAVGVLKGHTEGLWGLHDVLQDREEHSHPGEHPILKAGYKFLNAADKLHLDKHTYTALNEAAERRRAAEPHAEHRHPNGDYQWRYTPESHAQAATWGMSPEDRGSVRGEVANTVRERVRQLSPQSTDEEINESIRRHAHRAFMESQRRITGLSPDEMGKALKEPTKGAENEKATRYTKKPKKYSLANKSNFIGSLLKVSSPEHKMFVKRTKQLARQAGARQTREFPALHDTPNQSVPGVALAVYGHIQPDNAHALGSWVNGLLPNSPGYAIFHARPTGPDTLYRIRMEGSGHDARAKLDRSGITSRIFVPHKKGLDVLIPDKGNQMGQLVQSFAAQQKAPVEASQGHLITVGSQDQAQARDTFRGKVVKAESKLSRVKRYALISEAEVRNPNRRRAASGEGDDSGLHQLPTSVPDEELPWAHPIEEPKVSLPPRKIQLPQRPIRPNPIPEPTEDRISSKGLKAALRGYPKKDYLPDSPISPKPSGPLFSNKEYSNLLHYAHKAAFQHAPAFDRFLQNPDLADSEVHNQLVKHIVDAAHEMRKNGTDRHVIDLGNGKRLKIKIGKKDWNDYTPQRGDFKATDRYSRRRFTILDKRGVLSLS